MKDSLVVALPHQASQAAFDWNAWVGIPSEVHGNCWEFVRQLLVAARGVDVPPFGGDAKALHEEFVALPEWDLITLPEAEPFDLLIFKMAEHLRPHVGVVIGKGTFMHWQKGRATVPDLYHRAYWRNRIDEVYRYR